MNAKLQELESLLLDWETNSLDQSSQGRLREILHSSPEAREQFAKWQILSSTMKQEAETVSLANLTVDHASSASVAPRKGASNRSSWSRQTKWGLLSLVVMLCLLVGRVSFLEYSRLNGKPITAEAQQKNSNSTENIERNLPSEKTAQGVAVLTRLVDVEWSNPHASYEVGEILPQGLVTISSGYAQIEFFCGASVVVEGPAELDILNPQLAKVHQGRLRAHVPPAARGFTLEVDDMKVVDLGTEFGISVSEDEANVQVFDGEVELHSPAKKKQSLVSGEGLSRRADGQFSTMAVEPNHFVDIASLESKAVGRQKKRYSDWQSWSNQWSQDPRLIAYYTFEEEDFAGRKLLNSTEPVNSEFDGAIVGATQVSGRWTEKSALEFKRPGDRVRLHIPGEFGSLTLACWVKIDSLDRLYNSLFLTDNYNQGEPHWQILHTGQIYFSVRPAEPGTKGPRDQKVLSPSFWQPSLSGKWLHLATTYHAETGLTVHYLNGEAIHAETIPQEQRVSTTRIGTASLGNWASPTQPDAEFAIRNLNGSIDEFALFAAELSSEEIKEMYLNGKP